MTTEPTLTGHVTARYLMIGERFRSGVLTADVETLPQREREFGGTRTFWAWTGTVVAVAPSAIREYGQDYCERAWPVGKSERFIAEEGEMVTLVERD